MEKWLKISCLLCVFGFLREIRPSEPYVTEFLSGPWRNITEDQVNRQVYPMGTYCYLTQLVVVFLITDYLLYKPLIITIGITGTIVWSMLLWTTSLEALMILEFFYGTYMAAEVAYYTYIYAKVDKKYYPKVTSHTRAAMFAGKLVASISSQLLMSLELMDYRELNYVTLAAQVLATVWSFFLPKVDRSLYFHRKAYESNNTTDTSPSDHFLENRNADNEKPDKLQLSPTKLMWTHFSNAYTNIKVLQWSLWYAVGLCGYLQVASYVQLLWKDIKPKPDIAWNGAVDAIATAVATLFALGAGYLHAGRLKSRASLVVLAVLTALEGGAILLGCWTDNIIVSYTGYIIYASLYAFTITVAGAEVARYLEQDSFGLVFGINTLMALIFQTILTLLVVSESGFSLSARGQFTIYGFYYIAVGILYFVFVIYDYLMSKHSKNASDLSEE